jgi:hypothetical protein
MLFKRLEKSHPFGLNVLDLIEFLEGAHFLSAIISFLGND